MWSTKKKKMVYQKSNLILGVRNWAVPGVHGHFFLVRGYFSSTAIRVVGQTPTDDLQNLVVVGQIPAGNLQN